MMRDLSRLAKSTNFLKQVVVPERERERESEWGSKRKGENGRQLEKSRRKNNSSSLLL
jgi:hypothetical protein